MSSINMLIIITIIIISLCIVPCITSHEFEVNGKVLELDESNIEAAISTFDLILVDFYAPWCGHCKRLSPQLDKAAPMLSGLKKPVVIAKIDADKYSRVAKKYDIDGFPTLKIFMNGVPTDYYGPRKADMLVRYLKKFVAPDVTVLESDSSITEFVEAAGTSFPIFIGVGLDESALSNLAIKFKKNAWFSVAKDVSEKTMDVYELGKVPALVALHPNFNDQDIFYGPFEDNFVEEFIQQNLLPLTLPITGESLKLLKGDKRKIVLTIVEDETHDESKELIKLLPHISVPTLQPATISPTPTSSGERFLLRRRPPPHLPPSAALSPTTGVPKTAPVLKLMSELLLNRKGTEPMR